MLRLDAEDWTEADFGPETRDPHMCLLFATPGPVVLARQNEAMVHIQGPRKLCLHDIVNK